MNFTRSIKSHHSILLVLFFLVVMPTNLVAANINFKKTPIPTIIEAIAKITNKNFIIDPRVKGNATLIAPSELSKAELYDVLLAILSVHGFVAVPQGLATKIVPVKVALSQIGENPQPRSEDWIMEVIKINYLSVSKLVSILKPLATKSSYLVALNETGQLLISDRAVNVKRLKKIIKKIDVPTSQNYELIRLSYSKAEDMVALLQKLISKPDLKHIHLVADERTNRIIVSGPEQLRIQIRLIVADLDTLEETESTGIRVIYLKHSKSEDIVPILTNIVSNETFVQTLSKSITDTTAAKVASASAKQNKKQKTKPNSNVKSIAKNTVAAKTGKNQISVVSDKRINAIIISAPTKVLYALTQVINKLDIRRPQVLIEAIIAEVSISRANQLGVQWGYGGAQGVGFINFDNSVPTIASTVGSTTENAISTLAGVVDTGGSFTAGSSYDNNTWLALIKAITSDTETSILSMPTIVTLDNEEASIISGEEVPFATSTTLDSSGNPFNTIERKDIGISLVVTPQINAGGTVNMAITQEISNVQGTTQVEGAVDLLTSIREIKTNVEVNDGSALVLGGLIQDETSNTSQRVPGLGDIPYIGQLFSNNSNEFAKTNLMVFIRPKIIFDDQQSAFLTANKYDLIRQEQLNYYANKKGLLIDDANTGLILKKIDSWVEKNEVPFAIQSDFEDENSTIIIEQDK